MCLDWLREKEVHKLLLGVSTPERCETIYLCIIISFLVDETTIPTFKYLKLLLGVLTPERCETIYLCIITSSHVDEITIPTSSPKIASLESITACEILSILEVDPSSRCCP